MDRLVRRAEGRNAVDNMSCTVTAATSGTRGEGEALIEVKWRASTQIQRKRPPNFARRKLRSWRKPQRAKITRADKPPLHIIVEDYGFPSFRVQGRVMRCLIGGMCGLETNMRACYSYISYLILTQQHIASCHKLALTL